MLASYLSHNPLYSYTAVLSSLRLGACSLRLVACSLVPVAGAIANGPGIPGPLVLLDAYSRDLRFCYSDRVNHGHASLCLDPDFGTAAQRLVRTVNNCAWSVNYSLVAVVIRFVCFHRNNRFTLAALRIATNHVLVYVYIFFHVSFLFVRRPVQYCASIATYVPVVGPHLVSVASHPALHLQ